MNEAVLSLVAGLSVGVFFSLCKLPIPAPPVLSGVTGIIGVYLGGVAFSWVIERFFT